MLYIIRRLDELVESQTLLTEYITNKIACVTQLSLGPEVGI